MNRLFLRIYLGIAVVLVVGTLGTLYILSLGLDAARQRSYEERLIDSADFIKARVQADNLFLEEEELWRLARAARMPFQIRSADELPSAVQNRLSEDGETFVYRDENDRLQVYSLFMDGQVLVGRFGGFRSGDPRPFEGFRPDRFGRGGRGAPNRGGRPGFDRGPGPPGGPGGAGWVEMRNLFLLSVIGIPILLVGPAIYFLIRPLDRRIHALSHVATRFGEGDLDIRAGTPQADAFGELTGAFNRMADQIKGLIEGQNELLRAVSHELRTPLARLFFMVDDAEAAKTGEEKNKQLGRIQKTLTDMNDLVEELLTFVRLEWKDDDAAREIISVRSAVEEMPEVAHDLRDDVTVEVSCGNETVEVVPRLFRRAILNLVTNAARHAGSRVWLRSWQENGTVILAVDDDGPGVPEAQRQRILMPFIRADESRSSRIGGVGLGLAIVSRVMSLHDGSVEVSDSPEGGARFLLKFPHVGQGSSRNK